MSMRNKWGDESSGMYNIQYALCNINIQYTNFIMFFQNFSPAVTGETLSLKQEMYRKLYHVYMCMYTNFTNFFFASLTN